jgi:hypothetical protein
VILKVFFELWAMVNLDHHPLWYHHPCKTAVEKALVHPRPQRSAGSTHQLRRLWRRITIELCQRSFINVRDSLDAALLECCLSLLPNCAAIRRREEREKDHAKNRTKMG